MFVFSNFTIRNLFAIHALKETAFLKNSRFEEREETKQYFHNK